MHGPDGVVVDPAACVAYVTGGAFAPLHDSLGPPDKWAPGARRGKPPPAKPSTVRHLRPWRRGCQYLRNFGKKMVIIC